MKKSILIFLLFILTVTSFGASELDTLLKGDDEIFNELTTDTEELVPKEAFVEKLSGQAFLKRDQNEKWFQIIENTTIKEKDTVLTMENTDMRIRMEDETYINVGAKSKLYFETMRGKPQEEKMTETGLKLAWGKVFSNVRKKLESGGKYEIEAGSVVAGVRGTQYLVTLNKEGAVNIKVFEGRVFVAPVEVHRKKQAAAKRKKEENASNNTTDSTETTTDENTDTENVVTETTTTENETDKTFLVETNDQGVIEEIVLLQNDAIVVEQSGVLGEIIKHTEAAPVEKIKSEETKEQIQEIKKEAVQTLNISSSTMEQGTTTQEEILVNEVLQEQLQNIINQVEQKTTEITQEVETKVETVDVIVNIR